MMLDTQTLNNFQNIGIIPDNFIEYVPCTYSHQTLVPVNTSLLPPFAERPLLAVWKILGYAEFQ